MISRQVLSALRKRLTDAPKFRMITEMAAWASRNPESPIEPIRIPIPILTNPKEVLIEVKAASVNPIDIEVSKSGLFHFFYENYPKISCLTSQPQHLSEAHMVCGRDCSGIVQQVGGAVNKFKTGDEVMAVIDLDKPFGSHAEFVIAEEAFCIQKPTNVSHVEATCFPYVACTAWSALVSLGGLNREIAPKRKVLIHGGAGGVGSTAIQLLSAWNTAKVVATCSKDSFDLVESLGAKAVDYHDPNVYGKLLNEGPFDICLDCVDSDLSAWSDALLGTWRNCKRISTVNPLFHNLQKFNIPEAISRTAATYLGKAITASFIRGQFYYWTFFRPYSECMQEIVSLLATGKMKAVVDETYSFGNMLMAYEKVARRKGRGKTVIDFELLNKKSSEDPSD